MTQAQPFLGSLGISDRESPAEYHNATPDELRRTAEAIHAANAEWLRRPGEQQISWSLEAEMAMADDLLAAYQFTSPTLTVQNELNPKRALMPIG